MSFPCKCECHKDGIEFLHCGFPCCSHRDKKYIFADGKVDMERWGQIEKEMWEKFREGLMKNQEAANKERYKNES